MTRNKCHHCMFLCILSQFDQPGFVTQPVYGRLNRFFTNILQTMSSNVFSQNILTTSCFKMLRARPHSDKALWGPTRCCKRLSKHSGPRADTPPANATMLTDSPTSIDDRTIFNTSLQATAGLLRDSLRC